MSVRLMVWKGDWHMCMVCRLCRVGWSVRLMVWKGDWHWLCRKVAGYRLHQGSLLTVSGHLKLSHYRHLSRATGR